MLKKEFDNFVNSHSITVLVIEDNLSDFRFLEETLKSNNFKINIYRAKDGEEALSFLRREGSYKDTPTPDVILLDLGLPKKDGFQVLDEIKTDENLKHIPVIVVTISKDHLDVIKSYDLHANAYVIKPIDIEQFVFAMKSIGQFWFTIVRLPYRE